MKINHTSDLQSQIQNLLDHLISENKERGLQAVVYHRGELVADAWAGHTDASKKFPVDGDTLFPVFSVTKGIAATVVHRLAEQGLLDYGQRIAEYWPEFGGNGKSDITLAQVLSHSAGIPYVPKRLRLADLLDEKTVGEAMAEETPQWLPGSKHEYHAVTFGFVIGEVVRRATGLNFSDLLEREIKQPLRLQNLYIGLPLDLDPPIATLEEVGPELIFPPSDESAAVPWWMQPLSSMMNERSMQQSCNPATTGLMSARAIAKHYATLRAGGCEGIELLSPARVKEIAQPRILEDGTVAPHALGYALGGKTPIFGSRNSVFGHGGYGGSQGLYDPDHDFAFGFTRNRLRDPSGTIPGLLLSDVVRRHLS